MREPNRGFDKDLIMKRSFEEDVARARARRVEEVRRSMLSGVPTARSSLESHSSRSDPNALPDMGRDLF